jgi:hypothetical protein
LASKNRETVGVALTTTIKKEKEKHPCSVIASGSNVPFVHVE